MDNDRRVVRRPLLRSGPLAKAFAIAIVGLGATLTPRPANATLQWVKAFAGGCATAIAVAPNNVPWILGCGNTADREIFYMGESCNPICLPTWVDDQLSANDITTEYTGEVFATTSGGAVYATGWQGNPLTPIIGKWGEISPNNVTGFFGPVSNPGGCISALAVTSDFEKTETFVTGTVPDSDPDQGEYFYGLGCSSNPDNSIYVYGPENGLMSWQQVDPAHGSAAAQLVMFNQSSTTSTLSQSLWVLNSLGSVFRYNGSTFDAISTPGTGVYSITDHFIAYNSGPVFQEVAQWNDSTQSWQDYIGTATPDGTWIAEIAYANGVLQTTNGPVGPSALWGVDDTGVIYSVADVPPSQ